MRFAGQVAIVTGAGSGIGRATARLFAAEGARVLACDLSEGVQETVSLIAGDGGTAEAMLGDAGVEADVARAVAQAVAAWGGLDVMFANAGVSGGWTGLFDHSVEEWSQVLRVNLIGPYLAIKHAAPEMMKRGRGAIVCTASVAGLRSGAGPIPYSASKAGVINLVQVCAQQLAGSGVRVNAVCPGLIETGMTRFAYDAARAKGTEAKIGQLNPTRRGGEPDEIAAAVAFLASDAASYVNGQALAVDGGLSASLPIRRQELGQPAF